MPLTQMQQKKLLRKNASLDGYKSEFLYKAMKELDNPELTERIKKEFNSKKRKEEILCGAWENLNSIEGKIAKEFFGIRNREDIDKRIKDMRNKKTTASAESKVFAYNGQVITASSKQEAIQKIINKQFKPGIEVGVSLKTLWEETKKHKTDFGYLLDTKEKGYYDLKFPADGQILCEDGEKCTIKSINNKGDITLLNNNGIDETEFTLSKKESDIALFR